MLKKILAFGPIFIIFAAILWSFDTLLRSSLYTLAPIIVVFWEHLLGVIFISPVVWFKRKELSKLGRKEWLAVFFIAIFPSTLATLFYTTALVQVKFSFFSVVVLLQQLQPIWAILTAAIILKEKLKPNFIIWAILALIGAYLVAFKDLAVNPTTTQALVPALLGLLAGVFWGSATTVGKYVLYQVSFVITTFLRFSGAAFFCLIIIGLQGAGSQVFSLNTLQWQAILSIVLLTGTTAFLIYYYGLKRTPARVATLCELAWPASALLIDIFYLHKSFSVTQVLGMLILLASIVQVSWTSRQEETNNLRFSEVELPVLPV